MTKFVYEALRAACDLRRASRWLAVITLLGTTGCIDSGLVLCDNGLVCPPTERCDEIHRTCVLPEQLGVCVDVASGGDCMTGPISGGCFDGVCLPRGCGNRVVESGEMCDDGNQISADGCSGDCRSTEHCGNGFVDPGEACDDGNLQSRDGCDSRCNVEDAVWSAALAIAPRTIDAQFTAYDAARGRLVYVSSEGTWEWDGHRWTFARSLDTVDFGIEALFYDPDLERVCVIGTSLTGFARLYSWIDGRWQLADSADGPKLPGFPPQLAVAYDTARHRMMMIENATGAVWTVDATGTWAELPAMPAAPGESVVVFDPVASELVLETTESVEWIHDGSDWTSSSTSFGSRVSLAFDAGRGHVVLVDNADGTTHERIDGAWSATGDAVPCANEVMYLSLPLYYDDGAAALSVFSTRGELCQWFTGPGETWTHSTLPLPLSPIGATYDPVTRSFVVLSNGRPEDPASPTRAWRLGDDGWHAIETLASPYGRSSALAVYAPGRSATVLYGEQVVPPDDGPSTGECGDQGSVDTDTWSFDGADWSLLTSFRRDGMPCSNNAATYDATHHRVVLATYHELWGLADAGQTWERLATLASDGQVFSLAWDARNATLLAARLGNDTTSPLSEMRDNDWTSLEIIPSGLSSSASVLTSDQRAGTVIVIDNNVGRVWERAGPVWRALPRVPVDNAFAGWTAYDPSTGRILYVARRDNGTFAAILQRTSPIPLESCVAGEDADGDGLAGCSDPDCASLCP